MSSVIDTITIRPYAPGDWAALALIHDRARLDELQLSVGRDAFRTLEQTAEGEGLFDGVVWVAVQAGQTVGFLAMDGNDITWLYVDPHFYRRGIGRALLRHVLTGAHRDVTTTVLDGNEPALALYRSEGFTVTETRDGTLQGLKDIKARGHLLTRPARLRPI